MSVLSDKALIIAAGYLGPAARDFIERHCRTHCNIEFECLTQANLPELAKWIKISTALVLEKGRADEFANDILALGQSDS